MPLPVSTVSAVCRAIADLVNNHLVSHGFSVQVSLAAPAAIAPGPTDADHRLGIFFYRFEPTLITPDTLPGETWRLRLHCLITPFAAAEDKISAGENDLRILGEVIRLFHETPILSSVQVEGEEVAAEMIFQPLSVDEINRIWSLQKDVAYRPSIAYEVALVPIVPRRKAIDSQLVGAIGLDVHARIAAGGRFAGHVVPPEFVPAPDASGVDWAPQICFVDDGVCTLSLALQLGSPKISSPPPVLIAGVVGEHVSLGWEVWNPTRGWHPRSHTMGGTVAVSRIDPEAIPPGAAVQVPLPIKAHVGQAALHAVRFFRRPSDGVRVEVRSNPLLISLFGTHP